MDIHVVYVTFSSGEEAERLATSLVEQRLVACANISSPVTSIYEWEGKVHKASEVVMMAKTQAANLDAVIQHIQEQHSYTCPCIVTWPIAKGHEPYLEWITRSSMRPGPA